MQAHPTELFSWHPNPQIIVHRGAQFLFPAKIALGGLNRGMSQQELNLLQATAGLTAKLGAGAAKIVRRQPAKTCLSRMSDHHLPYRGFGQALPPNHPALVDGAKDSPLSNRGSIEPIPDGLVDPVRNGDGPYPLAFALNVGKHPAPLELLKVLGLDVRQLGAAQATTHEDEEHGAVALAL